MQPEILNTGLSLAMEWGEDWLKPIQSRLAKQFPTLTPKELDEVNAICQKAMRFGHQLVLTLAKQYGQESYQGMWETEFLRVCPWVNRENLGRLYSQGMYYAMK
ncbi:MAG: hypothetical protein Fur0022_10810 [Anaerolineales bacterium]